MTKYLLTGGTLASNQRADVLISDGVIVGIGENISHPDLTIASKIDVAGC
ncbi:MAG: dihydroorotase, partial [Actinobacteria bacterium]|nr:dihydroorotase [Actinomycetota bacterium]